MASITENEIELIALDYLKNLGYSHILGPDISPDGEHPERQYNEVVLVTRLRDAIDKLNPEITQDAKDDALKKVLRTDSPNALINNENFHRYLTEGIDVEEWVVLSIPHRLSMKHSNQKKQNDYGIDLNLYLPQNMVVG